MCKRVAWLLLVIDALVVIWAQFSKLGLNVWTILVDPMPNIFWYPLIHLARLGGQYSITSVLFVSNLFTMWLLHGIIIFVAVKLVKKHKWWWEWMLLIILFIFIIVLHLAAFASYVIF